MKGHLKLNIDSNGAELDADVNGFTVKVGGSMDALKPIFAVLWQQLKDQAEKDTKFKGILSKLKEAK